MERACSFSSAAIGSLPAHAYACAPSVCNFHCSSSMCAALNRMTDAHASHLFGWMISSMMLYWSASWGRM